MQAHIGSEHDCSSITKVFKYVDVTAFLLWVPLDFVHQCYAYVVALSVPATLVCTAWTGGISVDHTVNNVVQYLS